MSRIHTTLFTAVAAAALAGASSATNDPYGSILNVVDNSGSGLSALIPVSKLVFADVSGHGTRDCVGLYNGEVCLFYSPGGLDLALKVQPANGTVDLCTVAPATGAGPRRLVTTNSIGMFVWSLSKSGSWANVQLTGSGASNWINASMLRSGDVDGDGIEDVAGIASDGQTMLFAYGNGSGGFTTQVGPSFVHVVSDFTLANLDADAALEVAGMQANGVSIREVSTGTQTMFLRATGAVQCLTTLHRAGQTDQVAWLTTQTPGSNTVLYLANQSSYELPITLGGRIASFASAGDFNADGLDDLLVSHANWTASTLYTRIASTPPTPSFSPNPTDACDISVDGSAVGTQNPGPHASLVDVDNDGIPEVAGYCDGPRTLRVLMRDTPPSTASYVVGTCQSGDQALLGANYMSSDLTTGATPGWSWGHATNELELLIDEYGWAAFNAGTVNAFEVFVYKQLNSGPSAMTVSTKVRKWMIVPARKSTGSATNTDTKYGTTTTAPSGTYYTHLVKIPLTVPLSGGGTDVMPAMTWQSTSKDFNFYVEIAACHYDTATGTISNRKRVYKYGLGGTAMPTGGATTTGNLVALAAGQSGGMNLPFNCHAYPDSHGGTSCPMVKIGGYVALSSLPEFEILPIEWPTIELISGF
ncbi:MAG: VCBS repeat-containing protein [Planctomycetes bacterium]|nr:VCBS repeat-containing protein [Planctomycetota bacterium]